MATYYVRKAGSLLVEASPSGYYHFDGSDAAASDPQAVWTGETNADDGSTSTVAFTTTTGGSGSNFLKLEGTNAPASGATVNTVHVRFFLGPNHNASGLAFTCFTDGEAESLGEQYPVEVADRWSGESTLEPMLLATPTGGWTWAKVQALEIKMYMQGGTQTDIAKVDVIVNLGDAPDNPMGTIDVAAGLVAAADTVYVGAGVYREIVTMVTSGTSGNIISYIADVDGEQTGDAGLVIISAYINENSSATRPRCWHPNGKEFITIIGFVMTGGSGEVMGDALLAGNRSYEELTVEDCVLVSGHDDADQCVRLDVNDGVSPTSAGAIWNRCTFVGGTVEVEFNENASADIDMKWAFNSCQFIGTGSGSGVAGVGFYYDRVGTGAFVPAGIDFNNCRFYGKTFGLRSDATTTSNPSVTLRARNCMFSTCHTGLIQVTSDRGLIDSDYNLIVNTGTPFSNVTVGPNDRSMVTEVGLVGGLADLPLYRFWGWSPFRPWEPIRIEDGIDNYISPAIGAGDTTAAPAFDLYNEARPMGSRVGERLDTFHMDASDAGPTDPDVVWSNDANGFDGDIGTVASTTTPGSTTTNELSGEGTNAPATGGTISKVEVRAYVGATTGALLEYKIYEAGDLGGTPLSQFGMGVDNSWSNWFTLTAPGGGWTWAEVQGLEMLVFLDTGGTLGEVGATQIRVTSIPTGQDDIGAVEGRTRPEQETTTVDTGANAIRFRGAGFHDFVVPVSATSTTITVRARRDSNYAGTLPQIKITKIPGVADITDTVTVAANIWETLTSGAFTPTSAGVAVVRVISSDTSDDGECFFDVLAVT